MSGTKTQMYQESRLAKLGSGEVYRAKRTGEAGRRRREEEKEEEGGH